MEKHIKMTEWTEWRGVEVRQGKEGWVEGIPTALAVWGQLGESRTPCSGEQKLPHCPAFFSSYKIYAVRWQVVFYTYHYIFLFIINEWFFNLVSTLNDPLIFLNAIIRLKPISCWYFSPVRTLRVKLNLVFLCVTVWLNVWSYKCVSSSAPADGAAGLQDITGLVRSAPTVRPDRLFWSTAVHLQERQRWASHAVHTLFCQGSYCNINEYVCSLI